MVPWGQLRQPFLGWLTTVLTSEFTHFNLVIRLSKAKQLALPFSSLLGLSRWSVGPRVPRQNACLSEWSRSDLPETSFFTAVFAFTVTDYSWHDMNDRQAHDFQVWSFFFWWLSGEVKHIVHLIRWNLNSRYMPLWLAWTRARRGITQDS